MSDFKSVENNLKQMNDKYTSLETKFNNLIKYLENNSIQISSELIKNN